MRRLISIILVVFSLNTTAFECRESDGLDLTGFWNKSSEVFLGRVTSSKLLEGTNII